MFIVDFAHRGWNRLLLLLQEQTSDTEGVLQGFSGLPTRMTAWRSSDSSTKSREQPRKELAVLADRVSPTSFGPRQRKCLSSRLLQDHTPQMVQHSVGPQDPGQQESALEQGICVLRTVQFIVQANT